jgi:hypothetical protein
VLNEAIFCLCNIVAGPEEYVDAVLGTGVLPDLLAAMKIENNEIIENAGWTIANMIGERWEVCKEFLMQDYLEILASVEIKTPKTAVGVAFSLSNIAKQANNLSNIECKAILGFFEQLMAFDPSHCLWGIANILGSDSDKIELFLKTDMLKYALEGIEMSLDLIKNPSAMIIGHVSSGTEEQTDELLKKDLLEVFSRVLPGADNLTSKYFYWTLSNIAAGNAKQRDLIGNHRICRDAINGLVHACAEVRREAGYFYRNFTKLACIQHKIELINAGFFKVLGENIRYSDADCLELSLETCAYMLDLAKFVDVDVVKDFEENGCLKGIEDLVNHLNQKISRHAQFILKNYFP